MYDVIVLGATFAAAGIASVYKEKCLVIESRSVAGYEFFGAQNYGDADKIPDEKTALELYNKIFDSGKVKYGADSVIYPYFEACDILFATHVAEVSKTENGFSCLVHGNDGFCTYFAKNIVDTRCQSDICTSKTLNLLVESDAMPYFEGITVKKAGDECHFVLCIDVDLDAGFADARKKALEIIKKFSKGQRLIMSASEFDHTVKEDFPRLKDGVYRLPSKAYKNQALAFEAGRRTKL